VSVFVLVAAIVNQRNGGLFALGAQVGIAKSHLDYFCDPGVLGQY
jgi:hypothetical protein